MKVVIGRAADFIGPGVTAAAMGENVFGPAPAGRKAPTSLDPTTCPPTATPRIGPNLSSHAIASAAGAYRTGTATAANYMPIGARTRRAQLGDSVLSLGRVVVLSRRGVRDDHRRP